MSESLTVRRQFHVLDRFCLQFVSGACWSMGSPMKNLITRAFSRSIKKAPTSGMTRKALKDGPYLPVIALMLAIATGVAPIPKPQNPATITAAS